MGFLESAILSGVLYDGLKCGGKITSDYLKSKLSDWLLDDETLEKIGEIANKIPESYLLSQDMLKAYLDVNKELQEILKVIKSEGMSLHQENFTNEGTMFGFVRDSKIYTKNEIHQETNRAKPRKTLGKNFSIIEEFGKYRPVQVVKSFSQLRQNAEIKYEDRVLVQAEIVIPIEENRISDNSFVMLLFQFIPEENWVKFYDENYKMFFEMETSNNISLVQLQIKDIHQNQFVDIPLDSKMFYVPLNQLARREAWQSVRELCFVIFVDDTYIKGKNGFIKIKDLQLINQ